MGKLEQTSSYYWSKIQGTLFPQLEEELDPLTKKQQQLIAILELVRIESFLPDSFGCEGRPRKIGSNNVVGVCKQWYDVSSLRHAQ